MQVIYKACILCDVITPFFYVFLFKNLHSNIARLARHFIFQKISEICSIVILNWKFAQFPSIQVKCIYIAERTGRVTHCSIN